MTIVALAALAFITERGIAASRNRVTHAYQVRSQLSNLQLDVVQAHADETSSLLTGGNKDPQQSQQHNDFARRTIDEIRRLSSDNPAQQEHLEQLGKMLEERALSTGTGSQSSEAGVQVSASALGRERDLEKRDGQIGSLVRRMQSEEESLLNQRLHDWDHLFKRNVLMLGLAFLIVTVLLTHNFRLLLAEVAHTKSMEKHILENAASYRLMSARILELQDSERRKVARELHDSVGQYLVGLKINLNQLETGASIDWRTTIRETIELTDHAICEVRTMSHLLHPPLLEELGFLSAASWYVDEYGKRSKVKVSLLVSEPIGRLPRDVETALFRVLQEALTNVYRHAAAQSVDVRILCRSDCVVLTVADDGKGIPQEILDKFRGGAAPGIGLAGMRERLAEFGGRMKVESSSAGTVVEATIPTDTWSAARKAVA